NLSAGFGGEERGGESDVADVAARKLELAGEEAEIDVVGKRRSGRNESFPDAFAQISVGKRELDDVMHASGEGIVHVAAEVGGEDNDALVFLHFLEQIGDLDVGVAIVRVLDFGALAEEGVGFVEEENSVG